MAMNASVEITKMKSYFTDEVIGQTRLDVFKIFRFTTIETQNKLET